MVTGEPNDHTTKGALLDHVLTDLLQGGRPLLKAEVEVPGEDDVVVVEDHLRLLAWGGGGPGGGSSGDEYGCTRSGGCNHNYSGLM